MKNQRNNCFNLVDSSGYLEYFANTKNAAHFKKPIEDTSHLIVPTVILFEVFKKVLKERDETSALIVAAHLQQGKVIELSSEISLEAAHLSLKFNLPMADSLIYATTQKHQATLWTQDSDFKGLPGVRYFPKK